MLGNIRFYLQFVSTILIIIFIFMNFLGHWSADKFVQIILFFGMILSVFSIGMESEKKLKNRG